MLAIGVAVIALVMCAGGCEKTTHENLDRWMATVKGPDKLRSAVTDRDLAMELRAHAAQNLVRTDQLEWLLDTLAHLGDTDRDALLAALIPRLWDDARITGAMDEPNPTQIGAKDALFDVRSLSLANDDNRAAVDRYLVEWLTGGYYSGRARTGRHLGEQIIRAIGPAAGPGLITRARAVLAEPPTADGKRFEIEKELLQAMAASGHPDAVGMVLDIAAMDRDDPKLAQRAFDALHAAFVRSQTFERVPPDGLAPHLDKLVAIAKDDDQPGKIVNDSIDLIEAIGPPRCIPALVELMTVPHADEQYRWVAANAALRCGKAPALVAVTDALPRTGSYARDVLAGAIWEPMAKLDDVSVAAEQARAMLGSDSWITRVVGIELLGHLAAPATAATDAERVRELAKDRARLRGWWGDQTGIPKPKRKPEPTLGDRAKDVADRLERLSQG